MEWSLFLPLLFGAILFGLLTILAGVMSGRGNEAGAERVRDYGFLLLLAMAVWTVILVLLALFDEPEEVWDMVVITLIVVVFFAVLLVVFFAISLLIGAFGRLTSRRTRVTTDEL